MSTKIENIRNIGIIAHIDAGKTTVTERMLFCSGSTHRVGEVDKGTTETDFDEEEQERGITIYSACVTFKWAGKTVNLLDTPGHVDFTAEVERCLRVLDGGVVVFSAREGVEAQSETVWRQANKYKVPRICFINKLDREGASFSSVVSEIRNRLEGNPIPIQMPVGEGPAHVADPFRGLIDLIRMKYVEFADDGSKAVYNDIPSELMDDAELARQEMLEELCNFDNELMECLLQEESPADDLIHRVLREATLAQQIQPLVCGSALHGIGVPLVLDAVARYLPSPLDMPPVTGLAVKKRKEEHDSRRPDPAEPFCGLVFKVLPAKTGDLSWVRVYSGELKSNSRVLNPGKDKKENVAQLWKVHGAKREQIQLGPTGDIIAVIGLRSSVTGDTLCDPQHPILLETIEFPETVISMAIEPETTGDRKKLGEVLEMMKRQDPTFRATENEDTGQTLISGMGELHLEVIKNRLLRDFNLNVKVHKPRVNYRESVKEPATAKGECHRQIAGQSHFAEVQLQIEPTESAQGLSVTSRASLEDVPAEFLSVVLDELKNRSEGGGVIGGFPLSKLKVTVLALRSDETSNEIAFRIAAGMAFESALQKAGPIILEPVMRLKITTPEEHMGDFVGDLQQRRALIAGTENRGKFTEIEAHAPLAELFGYSSAMRSLSQGRAGVSMEPFAYWPAPESVAASYQM